MQININLLSIALMVLIFNSCKSNKEWRVNNIVNGIPLFVAFQPESVQSGALDYGEKYEILNEKSITLTDEIGGYSEHFSWVQLHGESGKSGWTLKSIIERKDDIGLNPVGRWIQLKQQAPDELSDFIILQIAEDKVIINPYAGVGFLKFKNPKIICKDVQCKIISDGNNILEFVFLNPSIIRIEYSIRVPGDGLSLNSAIKDEDFIDSIKYNSILYRL